MKLKLTDIIIGFTTGLAVTMTIMFIIANNRANRYKNELSEQKIKEQQMIIKNQQEAERLADEMIVLGERIRMRDSLLLDNRKRFNDEKIKLLTNANDSVLKHIILYYRSERQNMLHE